MKLINKILRLVVDIEFLPIETVAYQNDINPSVLKSLYYKPTYGNDKRFKKINGKLHIASNYYALLQEELQELYYKALIISRTQTNLAKELSILSGINQKTLERYFIRFNFKQIKKASEIIEYIKDYISKNSLFNIEELSYE